MILAVAIPFFLGFVGLLNFWTYCGAALVLAVCRRTWQSTAQAQPNRALLGGYAVVAAVAIVIFWPQFVRPPLDGDSLLYHLPNAAAWAVGHSIWTSSTAYWWYPPGSELFASAMIVVGGMGSLPIAGLSATMLLGLRLYEIGHSSGARSWSAAILAAAFITIPVAALQAGTLQNDVWLSAWLLEIVWVAHHCTNATGRTIAIAALIKPVGAVFVLVVCLVASVPLSSYAGLAPFAIWVVRDVILNLTTSIPIVRNVPASPFSGSIIAHSGQGIELLARALWNQGPSMGFATLVLVLAPFVAPRRYWISATLLAMLFLAEPFGYDNGDAQLATGASLRYLLPALAIAFAGILPLTKRVEAFLSTGAAVLVVVNIQKVLSIFWNDAATHWAILAGILLMAGLLCAKYIEPVAMRPIILLPFVFFSAYSVSHEPIRYYDAQFNTRLFTWLHSRRPANVAVWQLRAGYVNVVDPIAEVNDTNTDLCGIGRKTHAVLIAADTFEANPEAFATRRKQAKSCGSIVFEDAHFVATRWAASTRIASRSREKFTRHPIFTTSRVKMRRLFRLRAQFIAASPLEVTGL